MKKRFAKVYLEITNICNLHCDFCPGNTRPPHSVTPDEFRSLAAKLRPYTDYLYLHLMGEPLLHPHLDELLTAAGEMGYRVAVTTNGTLIGARRDLLTRHGGGTLYKLSVSLHAYEANGRYLPDEHFATIADLARKLSAKGTIVALRLWNLDGQSDTPARNSHNGAILHALHEAFPGEWVKHPNGFKLAPCLYLEWGERFDWPSPAAPDHGERGTCYGLRDQIGVLCDGTVVPCCLDGQGLIPLGNLHEQSMEDILASPRARAIAEGFANGQMREDLCRRCGFATRFQR